jgi:hypothetical protein
VYDTVESFTLSVDGSMFKTSLTNATQRRKMTTDVAMGESVTVTYLDSNEFYAWVNESGKIMSRSAEYTFIIMGNTTLEAIDVDKTESDEAMVVYMDNNNKVISQGYYNVNDAISVPVAPYYVGRTFEKWSMDEAAIKAAMATQDVIEVKPVYTVNADKFLVTVNYVDAAGKSLKEQALTEETTLAEAVTLTADAEFDGKPFSYWKSNGKIVGYNPNFAVRMLNTDDIVLEAVYGDDSVTTKEALVTVMDTRVSGEYTHSFVTSWNVPEEYTVAGAGVVYTRDDMNVAEENLVKGTANVRTYQSNIQSHSATFTQNVSTSSANRHFVARGYVDVTLPDGTTTTIYSDVVHTVNP